MTAEVIPFPVPYVHGAGPRARLSIINVQEWYSHHMSELASTDLPESVKERAREALADWRDYEAEAILAADEDR